MQWEQDTFFWELTPTPTSVSVESALQVSGFNAATGVTLHPTCAHNCNVQMFQSTVTLPYTFPRQIAIIPYTRQITVFRRGNRILTSFIPTHQEQKLAPNSHIKLAG